MSSAEPPCQHLLVMDLEATCDDQGSVPKHEMETIEIGAVMVRRHDLVPISEFQSFVRPVKHPQLTPFCTRLTSIQQQDVDAADAFPDVVVRLEPWLYAYDDVVLCTWGDYDVHQIEQDCRLHAIEYPLPGQHLNVKRLFSERQGISKKLGMAQALARAGLSLDGTHHRGIDDARNIARLLPFCV